MARRTSLLDVEVKDLVEPACVRALCLLVAGGGGRFHNQAIIPLTYRLNQRLLGDCIYAPDHHRTELACFADMRRTSDVGPARALVEISVPLDIDLFSVEGYGLLRGGGLLWLRL